MQLSMLCLLFAELRALVSQRFLIPRSEMERVYTTRQMFRRKAACAVEHELSARWLMATGNSELLRIIRGRSR